MGSPEYRNHHHPGLGPGTERSANDNGIRRIFKRNIWIILRKLLSVGHYFQIDGKQFQEQYKGHTSDFQWSQKEHAADWMFFPFNIGKYLSIDETALFGGELYTIVTNKAAKGRKVSIVATLKGTLYFNRLSFCG